MMHGNSPMFTFRRRSTNHLSLAGKLCACVATALIALLVWLSADPEAHELFHPHESAALARVAPSILRVLHQTAPNPAAPALPHHGTAEHHCVICDFAAGCTDVMLFALLVFMGGTRLIGVTFRFNPSVPRMFFGRHAPSCGPPLV